MANRIEVGESVERDDGSERYPEWIEISSTYVNRLVTDYPQSTLGEALVKDLSDEFNVSDE